MGPEKGKTAGEQCKEKAAILEELQKQEFPSVLSGRNHAAVKSAVEAVLRHWEERLSNKDC